MASKLRRAPLFGMDNPLGIPHLPSYSSAASSSSSSTPSSGYNKRCQNRPSLPVMKSTKPPPLPPKGHKASSPSSSSSCGYYSRMEVGVASFAQGNAVPRGTSADNSSRSSPRGNLHVEFAQVGELKEKKEKYLTAKYGAHQMSLIRKRLGVEMWMYDQLQLLYQAPKEGKSDEKEVDLDELLDMDEDSTRRKFLLKHLQDSKQTKEKIETFITELLERAKTL